VKGKNIMKSKRKIKCTEPKKFIRFIFILSIFITATILFILYQLNFFESINIISNSLNGGQLTNDNYIGIGRESIDNQDGYSSTFSTASLSSDISSISVSTSTSNKVYKEYKQNGNSSWSNKKYWDSIMSAEGCGITSMSIILSGYNIDYTPEDLRQKYFPVLSGDNISSELSETFGITNSDFYYDKQHLSNEYIINHLKSNRPVLICVWNKPIPNRWTTASHYMVLLACDDYNMVYVSNPNGLDNTNKNSGWYNINEVSPYIAKALFVEL